MKLVDFEKILRLYELWPAQSEVPLLLRKYERVPPVRCSTLGRDAHMAEHHWIDYIAFCGDIEPNANGRDLDHLSRVLATDWLTKVPDKSVCVQDLEGEVAGVRRRLARDESRRRQSMVGLSLSSGDGAPSGSGKSFSFGVGENDLGHYESMELKKLMKQYDVNGDNALSREELKEALEHMEMHGRKFAVGTSSADDVKGYAKTAEDVEREAKTDPDALFEMLFDAFDSNDDGKIDWNEFFEGIMHGVKDPATGVQIFPPLQWAWLSADEAEEKSKKLFAEAEQRQNRFVIGGGKDKAERAKIAHLTSSATKLQQLAQQQRGVAKSDSDAELLTSGGPGTRCHDHITLKVALPQLEVKKKVERDVLKKDLATRVMRDAHLTQPLARTFQLGRQSIAQHDTMIMRDAPPVLAEPLKVHI